MLERLDNVLSRVRASLNQIIAVCERRSVAVFPLILHGAMDAIIAGIGVIVDAAFCQEKRVIDPAKSPEHQAYGRVRQLTGQVKPQRAEPLYTQIQQTLSRAIAGGALGPGTVLLEGAVADILGCTRVPVRQAFRE